MAYPIVHLLVAERCAPIVCPGAPPEYYLGAVSPDAIHMRPGITKKVDKARTHLHASGDGVAAVRAYWDAAGRTPYTLGYGVHVLTDRLWVGYYPREMPGLIGADGHTIVEVYQPDADWNDRMLAAREPSVRGLMRLLERAAVPEDDPFLRGAEIAGWRGQLVRRYAGTPAEPAGRPAQMPQDKVRRFIGEAAGALAALDIWPSPAPRA